MTNAFDEWDRQCDHINSDKQMLYQQMKECLKKEESADALYRMAKAKNKDLEKMMATEALQYADMSCKKDNNNPNCHKWYCAAVGKLATLSAAKERLKYGKDFKDHADIALRLNPNDQLMQSMYGQWCYNVASLSWVERKVAAAIYGEVPNADYNMALQAFKKVQELNPESKENHLWLAKTHIALKQTTEAKQYLQKGLTLPNKNINDEIAHQQLDALNKKYK